MAQTTLRPRGPDGDDEALRLERRRKQCRVSQRRYRDKKGSTEYNLRLDVSSLRERVQTLQGLRELLETKLWSSRLAQNAAVLKAVEQYYAVFEQGLHNPEAGGENVRRCFDMQLGFLRAFIDADVQFGDTRGVDQVLEQWRRTTQFHAWIDNRFVSAEVFGSSDSPIVVAQGMLTVLVSPTTLEYVFPRVLTDEALTQALLGQEISFPTSTTFSFNERAQVERLDCEVDFLAGLNRVLDSAYDTSRVLRGAFLSSSKFTASVDGECECEAEFEYEYENVGASDQQPWRMLVGEPERAGMNEGSRLDLNYIMT